MSKHGIRTSDVPLTDFVPGGPTLLATLNDVVASRKSGVAARQARERLATRMDSAATVLLGSSVGLAEQFVNVIAEADKVPLTEFLCMANMPVNSSKYPFGPDSHKRYIVRGAGSSQDATGEEAEVVEVSVGSVPVAVKPRLVAVQYSWTWMSQVRSGWINFDEIGTKAEQARWEAARANEEFFMWGRPALGMAGVLNNANVHVSYNAANAAGSTLLGSSTDTEIWQAFNTFLGDMRSENILDAYDADTLMVPRWLMIRIDQGIIQMPGPAGSPISKSLRQSILESNPQIKNIVENFRLDYRDANGNSTAALTGDSKISLAMAYRNEERVFHMGSSLQYEELPMFQEGTNKYSVRAYTCPVEPVFLRPHACRLLVV